MSKLKSLLTVTVKFLFLCFGIVVINSCIKEEINLDNISDEVELDYGFVGPIAYGELNLKDILESVNSDNEIKFYPNDSLLYLVYKDEILSKKAEDFILIPNLSITKNVTAGDPYLPVSVSGAPFDTSITTYYTYTVTNGEEIDSMFIKAGTLKLQVSSTIPKTGTLKLILPEVTKNGVALQVPINITVGSGNFLSPILITDLNGYKLSLGANNQLKVIYDINFNAAGSISSSNSVNFNFSIEDVKFSSLYGYISNRELFNQSGSVEMTVFDVSDKSTVQFFDPRIRMFVCNSFGVPFDVNLTNTRTYSKLNDKYVNLILPSTKYSFGSAISLVTCQNDTVAFNRDNSNLGDAIASVPKTLFYSMNALSNPAGKVKNFVTDNSEFKVSMEVELPFHLKADKYEYTDTIDFDVSKDVNDLSIFKSAAIYDSIQNWFPFEVETQIIFVDSNYVAVDTLYGKNQQPFIKAGTLGSNGRIIAPAIYSDYKEYRDAEILKFEKVKHVLFKVAAFSKGYDTNTFVKVLLSDKIKLRLGIRAQVKITNLDQL